jgi:taurine dioxygenase
MPIGETWLQRPEQNSSSGRHAMPTLDIRPLTDEHPFGARIGGVTRENVSDETIRQRLRDVFEDRGMIVFEGMEPSEEMQLALSDVFGPCQPYAIKDTKFEDARHPGLISLGTRGKVTSLVEIDGKQLAGHVGWHFDACYVARLNRAGLLRLEVNSPVDGRTGFADGVQMYRALPPEWQAKAEAISVVYHQYNMYHHQRFGLADSWRLIELGEKAIDLLEVSKDAPRSVHPAVWQRASGEKVLHVSPWQADGVAGREAAEGDAALRDLIAQMYAVMQPNWHDWKSTDMVIWDNWRFLHSAGGYDPQYDRIPWRTTIQGDYGLGCLLDDWRGAAGAAAA